MKNITIKLDPEMGYTTTWVAYADAAGVHGTGRARTGPRAVKRALKQLQRKIDHARDLH